MASKPKEKMTNGARAKQFAPFSALRGLSEALQEKERLYEPQKELSEDAAAMMNETLCALTYGARVAVCYYDGHTYQRIEGVISMFSKTKRILEIENREISFSKILTITRLFGAENTP